MVNIVEYQSCGKNMKIIPFRYKQKDWVKVVSPNQPQRIMRIFKPGAYESIVRLYGYVDSSKCLNTTSYIKTNTKTNNENNHTLNALSDKQINITGIPQRTYNSGLCWYCAMCFVMFFGKQMRTFLTQYMTHELKYLSENILTDATKSEAFRKHLYEKYSLGDKPGQSPELDGQNGFSQFCILAAKLGIPVIRLFAPKMIEMNGSWFEIMEVVRINL